MTNPRIINPTNLSHFIQVEYVVFTIGIFESVSMLVWLIIILLITKYILPVTQKLRKFNDRACSALEYFKVN